jgi:hypothetical protein
MSWAVESPGSVGAWIFSITFLNRPILFKFEADKLSRNE